MSPSLPIRFVFSVLGASLLTGCHGDNVIAQPSAERQQRVERLIEELAAKDPSWVMKEHSENHPPGQGSSGKERKRVVHAAETLVNEGVVAFPVLADHIDDKRFSFNFLGPNGSPDFSVGLVCYRIVEYQVDAWEDSVELLSYPKGHPRPQISFDDVKEWVRKHEGQSLKELQIEAAEMGLQWLKDTKGMPFRYRGPVEASEPLRLRSVQNVENLLNGLKTGDAVARRRTFFDSYGIDQGK